MSKLDQLVGHLSVCLETYSEMASLSQKGEYSDIVRAIWMEKHAITADILKRLIEAMKEDEAGMYGKDR